MIQGKWGSERYHTASSHGSALLRKDCGEEMRILGFRRAPGCPERYGSFPRYRYAFSTDGEQCEYLAASNVSNSSASAIVISCLRADPLDDSLRRMKHRLDTSLHFFWKVARKKVAAHSQHWHHSSASGYTPQMDANATFPFTNTRNWRVK